MIDETFDGSGDELESAPPTSDWETALAKQQAKAEKKGGAAPSKPAHFDELDEGSTAPSGSQNLNFLLDIPLNVTVELGRTSMIINRMLQLTQGSVIELEKVAGEPVEIYINQKLLGKGEVVVVNDRFGVRITEIISRADRIKNMG